MDISINGPAEARTFMESGLVKPLVVMGGERFKNLPDVPICAEFGYDVDFPIWRGVFTTHDTDPAILKILSDAVKKATESEEFLTFAESGMAIKYRGYEEFTEFFNKQKEVYAGVMPGIMAEINAQ